MESEKRPLKKLRTRMRCSYLNEKKKLKFPSWIEFIFSFLSNEWNTKNKIETKIYENPYNIVAVTVQLNIKYEIIWITRI